MKQYLFAVPLALFVVNSFNPCVSYASPSAPTAADVKKEFLHAWNAYEKYAWGHDEVKPLTKGAFDWYKGGTLLMTPVDALDTMILMGLNKEADKARKLITSKLTFDLDMTVNVFEVTIRLVGGLIAGFELTHDPKLLSLAEDLGKRLLPAFNSPTKMPFRMVNLRTGKPDTPENSPSEVGSLILEFGKLSKLTGNNIYYDTAKRALVELYKRSSKIGLVGSHLNVETGQWTDPAAHVGCYIDSYYEYLYKGWLLFGDRELLDMWKRSRDAINKYVADEVDNRLWYGRTDMNDGRRLASTYGGLDAFFAGLLALSGDFDRARKLQESNFYMWTKFGLEPELFDYRTGKVTDPYYPLRPEIIESAYYLYYFTGDRKYQEMGQTFVDAILKYTKVDGGFAEIADVTKKTRRDAMPSFLLAETLKYAYLLFSPKNTLNLDRIVFNTEAHLLEKK